MSEEPGGDGQPPGPALARAALEAALARRSSGRGSSGRGSRGRLPGPPAGGDTPPGGGDPKAGTGGGSPEEAPGDAAGRGRGRKRGRGASAGGGRWRWSAPGPDRRDPQPFGAVLAKLVADRGWARPAAEATVFGSWEKVVGPDLAQHCRPVKLADGVLTVEAVSTAWATQLRLLAASLLKSIAAEVGHGVVTRLNIHGPAAPSWDRGPRRVRGRGPRDTYG